MSKYYVCGSSSSEDESNDNEPKYYRGRRYFKNYFSDTEDDGQPPYLRYTKWGLLRKIPHHEETRLTEDWLIFMDGGTPSLLRKKIENKIQQKREALALVNIDSRIEKYKESKKQREKLAKRKVVALTPIQIARINKSLGRLRTCDEFILKIHERDIDFLE